ncbi:hypothetical protein AGLY_009663 [Aphis glycines]|uniref:Uncharacterized protein n=1 Tax=Aphis glycines TaxID=307491 RepID=A0A6G0TIP1_APHGL|nr:hypothetical protein AGLY_009663 [Aphis glycines]
MISISRRCYNDVILAALVGALIDCSDKTCNRVEENLYLVEKQQNTRTFFVLDQSFVKVLKNKDIIWEISIILATVVSLILFVYTGCRKSMGTHMYAHTLKDVVGNVIHRSTVHNLKYYIHCEQVTIYLAVRMSEECYRATFLLLTSYFVIDMTIYLVCITTLLTGDFCVLSIKLTVYNNYRCWQCIRALHNNRWHISIALKKILYCSLKQKHIHITPRIIQLYTVINSTKLARITTPCRVMSAKNNHTIQELVCVQKERMYSPNRQVGTSLLYIKRWGGPRTRISLTLTFGENFKTQIYSMHIRCIVLLVVNDNGGSYVVLDNHLGIVCTIERRSNLNIPSTYFYNWLFISICNRNIIAITIFFCKRLKSVNLKQLPESELFKKKKQKNKHHQMLMLSLKLNDTIFKGGKVHIVKYPQKEQKLSKFSNLSCT